MGSPPRARGNRRKGLLPDEVSDLLAPYGWAQVEQLGPQEFAERYLESSGRMLPVSEIERTVHCIKVSG